MSTSIRERNNVTVRGEGDAPMLFAHGFGCDQNMWQYVLPYFEPDYRCVLFDYVGFGQSDASAYDSSRYDSLEGYAQQVLEVCDALDLQDVVFVGHSVSGVIGMLAAIERPELFSELALVCPSPRYINDLPEYRGGFEREEIEHLLDVMDKNYIGWARSFAPQVVQVDQEEAVEEMEEAFCSTDPTIAREFAEVTFLSDNRDDVARVPVPTLAIECRDDALVPEDVCRFLQDTLPQGRVTELDATGHCPHMTCPEETATVIRDYLASPERLTANYS